MPHNLSSYLQILEKENLLKRVAAPVVPVLEINEIVQKLYREIPNGENVPAVLFENVKNSSFPVLVNLLGTDRGVELALGEKPEGIGAAIADAALGLQQAAAKGSVLPWIWEQKGLLLKAKSARGKLTDAADFRQVRKSGAEVNLEEFPILKCWPLDGGKFITAGLVFTRSPKTGARNVGIYRLQVLGKNELGLHWQIQKGGGFHYHEAEEMNQPLEVAVVIGADPILWMAGILPLPEGMDEISFAGFMRGSPVPMARCEKINLEVPASAEIVIEGIVRPGRREMEGPFGDHFGHYSHASPFPALEIQSISHKKNAIYHAAVVGKPPQEDRAMGEAVTKIFAPIVRLTKPEVVNLWAYYEAGFHNLLVASVRQRYEKEAIKSALSILGEGQLSLTKCVILVDPDVDVRDFKEVLRSLRENFRPEKDFILLPQTSQDTLDFTGPKLNLGSKMILDATAKKGGANGAPWTAAKLTALDPEVSGAAVFEETMLVAQTKGEGKELLKRLLVKPELKNLKVIALVSPDVPLDDPALTIWGVFTRFDCERDVLFAEVELKGIRAVGRGAMGIDATWKKDYPKPVEMSPEVEKKVNERWKEYGLLK